ncbi:MAG TPA: phosphatidate cytidylyltransferase [Burkholderiales bacterium]|nr:phosphatidate cytidylyltransferase [Burkholderiales bacterium]
MLKTRALTAAVLLAVFGSALFLLPQWGWIAFCAVLLGGAVWEWGGLAALAPAGRTCYTVLLVLLFLSPLLLEGVRVGFYAPVWVYGASGLFWVLLAPLWIWRGPHLGSRGALLAAGIPTLVPAGAALVDLRGGHPALLLAVLGTVWISDSAAYFVGRRFGKRKLAPSISPGKTWEGVAGALAAVGVYAFAWAGLGTPQNPWVGGRSAPGGLLAVLLGLAVVGIIGDLFESLIKRQAGVKDSGTLLPGHGGILDRIDAPVAVLPLAVLAFMR